MYECIGNRSCGGSARDNAKESKEGKLVSPLVSDDVQILKIQDALEELEKKLESRYSTLFTGLHNISELSSRVDILTDKVRQQDSVISGFHNPNELSNTVNALTQRLQDHEQLLQGIIRKNESITSSRKQGEENASIAEENPSLPVSNPEVKDLGMKGLQQEQAALTQRVTDVEKSTFTLRENLEVVFTKGPQCEAFRRSLLDDFGVEIEKRLNITQHDHEAAQCEQRQEKHLVIQEEHDVDPPKDMANALSTDLANETIEEEGVALQESLWDASLLIGWHAIGMIPNLVVVFLVLSNIIGQMLFCAVIDTQFTDPGLPDKARMEYWRANAHSQVNQDPITGATLVSRVCNQDSALQVADSQVGVVGNAQAYQQPVCMFFACMVTGPTTFIVAWLLWALVAVNEGIAAITLFLSFVHIPRGKRTHIEHTEGGFEISSLSFARLCFLFTITFIRVLVCILLFIFGTMWLAYTVNVQNLVLNASALGFVLDMDNLLFDAFIPPVVKAVLTSLKPIPLPHPGKSGTALRFASYNIGVRPVCSFLAIATVFIWTWTQQVMDMDNQLTILESTLCSGDQNFMWELHEELSVLLATPTPQYVKSISDFGGMQSYKLNAVRQLWNRTFSPFSEQGQNFPWLAYMTANDNVYDLLGNTPVRELTYNNAVGNSNCDSFGHADFTGMGLNNFIITGLQATSANNSAAGCQDIVRGCGFGNASNLRLYCPSQCGCGNPRSGLYYGGPSKGCPRDKCVQSVTYTSELSKVACRDPDNVNVHPGWVRYWREFEEAQVMDLGNLFQMAVDGTRYNATMFAHYAKQLGCGLLSKSETVGAFCFETDEQASLAAFCPVACGCRIHPSVAGCPDTCHLYFDWYQLALQRLPCVDVPLGAVSNSSTRFYNWAIFADVRYMNSYYIGEVLDEWQITRPSLAAVIGGPMDFWLYLSDSGCETVGNWICDERLGPFNGFSLCAKMCGCGNFTASKYCPENCFKGDA